ncbi:hypothetical protein ACFWU5_01935 [Nocardia sp. NPDC058640]|uniref:hypothetical protein n=1 Tax=Nocardia sp. NPDC058640 TaxID=3346571 RepID=UPI0036481DD4
MPNKIEPDIRDTSMFKTAQNDEGFQSWLLMHDAALQIEFTVFEVPELAGFEFTREGLVIAEQEIMSRFDGSNPFSEENYKLGMRFYYFIGETFRRSFEGIWVALPSQADPAKLIPAIDLPFMSGFKIPRHMMGFVRQRRTGTELTWIYDRAAAGYAKWVDLGRPTRETWEGYL